MSTLNLKIPAQFDIDNPEVETRPAELAHWIDNLPYVDANVVINEITTALIALNKQKVPPQVRLTLLDLYNKPVNFVLKAIEEDYLRQNRRATDKKAVRDNITKNMLNELSLGYKAAVIESQQQKKLWGQGKLSALTIQRAVRSLSQLLVIHYLTYSETPAGIWNEIYQLYSYAEANDLKDAEVRETDNRSTTVEQCFKQVTLLGLIGAYGLRPAEIMSVYRYLEKYASSARLIKVKKLVDPYGHFIINMRSDERAWPYAHLKDIREVSHWCMLNTAELLICVTRDINTLRKNKKPSDINMVSIDSTERCIELLKHLHVSWGTAAMRHSRREAADGVLQTVTGLMAIYYFLNGEKNIDHSKYTGTVNENDIRITSQRDSIARRGSEVFSKNALYLINQSEGGLAVYTESDNTALQVGQLIGILSESNTWKVGVVRWFHNKKQRTEAGIQYIATDARPVSVRSSVGEKIETEFREGLMFTRKDKESKTVTDSLLIPKGLFKKDRTLKVDVGNKIIDVTAENLIESSNYFEEITVQK